MLASALGLRSLQFTRRSALHTGGLRSRTFWYETKWRCGILASLTTGIAWPRMRGCARTYVFRFALLGCGAGAGFAASAWALLAWAVRSALSPFRCSYVRFILSCWLLRLAVSSRFCSVPCRFSRLCCSHRVVSPSCGWLFCGGGFSRSLFCPVCFVPASLGVCCVWLWRSRCLFALCCLVCSRSCSCRCFHCLVGWWSFRRSAPAASCRAFCCACSLPRSPARRSGGGSAFCSRLLPFVSQVPRFAVGLPACCPSWRFGFRLLRGLLPCPFASARSWFVVAGSARRPHCVPVAGLPTEAVFQAKVGNVTNETVYPEMFLFGIEGVPRIHHVDGIQPTSQEACQATPS